MRERLISALQGVKDELLAHRRYLHSNPEIGFNTENGAQYIMKTLEKYGVKCAPFSKNGVVACIEGRTDNGKTVLLRADIDALEMREETNLDFASKNGCMHACGHDMHTAMLLCSAKILNEMKDTFCGKVKFLFQPAEEIMQGAKDAIENGILCDTNCAMTIHVMTATELETGTLLLPSNNPCAPSADFFEISVYGKACHGSSPNTGVDPIGALCRIVLSLDEIKTREIGICDKAVLTVGCINAGNSANVIPEKATMCGTLRCFDEKVRQHIKQRMEEIVHHIASAFRCESELVYTSSCPCLVNDNELLGQTYENFKEFFGEQRVFCVSKESGGVSGSEDFAHISQLVPTVYVALCAGKKSDGYDVNLHNPRVMFDESALETGCLAFCVNALKILQN